MNRNEIMAGLHQGRTLIIERRDSPVLSKVLQLEAEGLVKTELRQHDEQSSDLKVTLP